MHAAASGPRLYILPKMAINDFFFHCGPRAVGARMPVGLGHTELGRGGHTIPSHCTAVAQYCVQSIRAGGQRTGRLSTNGLWGRTVLSRTLIYAYLETGVVHVGMHSVVSI